MSQLDFLHEPARALEQPLVPVVAEDLVAVEISGPVATEVVVVAFAPQNSLLLDDQA